MVEVSDAVLQVRELLGPSSTDDWSNEDIQEKLDAQQTPEQIASAWWQLRASQTANLIDVSESGSSRQLSAIHKNALEMAKFYDGKVDDAEEDVDVARRGLRSRVLRRV